MNMDFSFLTPVRVVIGAGTVTQTAALAGGGRRLIVTDAGVARAGAADRVKAIVDAGSTSVFDAVEANPSCATVNAYADLARSAKVEVVIGLGGGSAMDTAKAVSALIANPGRLEEYLHGRAKLTNRRARLLLVPTTAGTGSEVTNVGVFTDPALHVKKPLVDNGMYADVAIVDPELTHSMPPRVTASTGLDAFCHAIESYWATSSQPFSDSLALGAMRLIMDNLPKAFSAPGDVQARGAMAVASTMAGVAFGQTRTTILHAASFPLTNDFGVPHGTACALTLVPFIRFNAETLQSKMAGLARHLGFVDVAAFAEAVDRMQRELGMPTRLSQVGISAGDVARIAAVTMEAPIARLNPRSVDAAVMERILNGIL